MRRLAPLFTLSVLAGLTGSARAEEKASGEPFVLCPPEAHPKRPIYRSHELKAALERRDFDRVEAIYAELKRSPRSPGVHASRFVDYQLAFDHTAFLPTFDAWVAAKPRSSPAHTSRAAARVSWAWEARGSGWAKDVSEQAWATFRERLELALADVERAMELDPTNHAAPAAGITVAMGLSLGRDVAQRFLVAAEAADPGETFAHRKMLTFLQPRWFGEPGELVAFARKAVRDRPDEPSRGLLLLDAHRYVSYDRGEAYLRQREVVAEVVPALDRVNEAYPKSTYAWRTAAEYLMAIGAFDRACVKLERAAELEDFQAWALLAGLLYQGIGCAPERRRAIRLSCQAAHEGVYEGMAWLALALLTGDEGLTPDVEAAITWATRSVEHGLPHGKYVLGWALAEHRPGERGRGRALVEEAAKAGHTDAGGLLGLWLVRDGDVRQGLALLQRAANGHGSRAQLELGKLCQDGAPGIKRNPKTAVVLFRQAAARGEREAARQLERLLAEHPELGTPGQGR